MAHAALLNLNVSGAVFDAAFADLMQLKIDESAGISDIDARRKAIAAWANFTDDVLRALQRQAFDHETRIADVEAAPVYSPTFATPVAVGAANSAGVASTLVRSDHVHALTAQVIRDANIIYDSNWGALATNAFTDGTEVIDGVNWTVAVSSAAGAAGWGIGNVNGFGQGAEWSPSSGGSSKVFNSTTQTAAHLYTTFGTLLGTNFDPGARYMIEVQYTITLNVAEATRLYVGLWSPSGVPTGTAIARQRLAAVVTQAGPVGSFAVQRDAAAVDTINSNVITGTDVIGVVVEPDGSTTCFGGLYSGGWPRADGYHIVSTALGNGPPLNRADTRIVFSSSVNAATPPLSRWTIHRVRVRKV